MADINNFTEITENFDTIKTLLNSIRAQGILNTSDVDKLLAGINSKLEKLNTEEDIDLIKVFLSELKQNLDERHSVLLSKFGAIESLFSNLLKNSSETLKSSEVKELFDIVATNLSVFSREVVSQKETLSDIILRLDAMRSDDSLKKDLIKNISFLKNDIERLTNGFDSIVLSLNENFKTVIKSISSVDPSETVNNFGKELQDIVNSSNTILSAIQMLDKKNLQIEDAIKTLATQDDLTSAKKWISDLAAQEQLLTQSIDSLADKYYKIDNLADKIDATVEIIAGLKTLIADKDDKAAAAIIDKLNRLEIDLSAISSNSSFEEFKHSLEAALNNIYNNFNVFQESFNNAASEVKKINESIAALDLNVNFKGLASDLSRSEQSIREHVSVETDKVIQLVDVNAARTLNELSANADNLGEKIHQAQSLMSTLCEKSFSELEESILGLKTIVSQIDENNVSANNAIFSNITDRLAMFENSLKASLEKQEDYVSTSSDELIAQINGIKDLSGVLDYKLDSSVIEINNAKTEFSTLRQAVNDMLALDFVNKVSDLKVDLYAVKQDLTTAFESSSADFSEKFTEDLFRKYELLVSKLDSVEEEIKQAQASVLNNIKTSLDNISSSLVDILSYVSSVKEVNIGDVESKLDNLANVISDNNLTYIENVRDIIDTARVQVENNIKNLQDEASKQAESVNSLLNLNSEAIRDDIRNSYNKILEVQSRFDELKDALRFNNTAVNENISSVISTATALKEDFDNKLVTLKNSILDKVADFQKEFTCENADKISELKFASEALHTKSLQVSDDIKNELKGEISQLIGSLRLNIEELTEQLAGTSIKLEGANHDIVNCVKNDFSSSLENFNSQLQDFSGCIDTKLNDVITKFSDVELSVNNLSGTATNALASALAKILDNFVSLKTLLGNLNDKTADDIRNNVDTLAADFEKLSKKIEIVDSNIDEDFTRQLSIIETNFEYLKKNIADLFGQTNETIDNTISAGMANVSANIRETVIDNLNQYKEQVESLFNNISIKNDEQIKLMESKVIELNSILQQSMNEQNIKSANTLNELTENLRKVLSDNIELTLADYKSLKEGLNKFAKTMESQNSSISEYLKTKLGDIAKFVDTGLNVQAQAINEKFNDITLEVSEIASATTGLNNEITNRVSKISAEINNLKSDLSDVLGDNSELIANKLEVILAQLTEGYNKLSASTIAAVSETKDSITVNVSNEINNLKTALSDVLGDSFGSVSDRIDDVLTHLSDECNSLSISAAKAGTDTTAALTQKFSEGINRLKSDLSQVLGDKSEQIVNKLNVIFANKAEEINNSLAATAKLSEDLKEGINQKLSDEINDLKVGLSTVFVDSSGSVMNKMDVVLDEIYSEYDKLQAGIVSAISASGTEIGENLNSAVQNSSGVLNAGLVELKEKMESLSEAQQSNLASQIYAVLNEIKNLNNDVAEKTTLIKQAVSEDVAAELKGLADKINSLFEEHSLNILKQYNDGSSKFSELLNAKTAEFMTSLQSLNDRLDKNDISYADVFQTQLKDLSVSFNTLLEETKNATKAEFSSIVETLLDNHQETIQEVEIAIDDKVNSILAVSADISAGELQSMEVFANKILEQINISKDTVVSCRDFITNFVKSEVEIISGDIEKETDVIVKDLLEQMDIMKGAQKDELSKLAIQLENVVEDCIYNNINELKSYIDIKNDTSVLNSKIDNINSELSRTAEDILAVSGKLLEASVFENTISDMKSANNVLITSMAENLNKQIQNFVQSNITQCIDDRFNLFDKKFVDTVVDKYEELKLISTQYNNAFDTIQASVKDLLSRFTESKEEIYRTLLSVLNGINGEIDELNLSFADLKAHILNKSFDEAFQASINTQINGIQELIQKQFGYLEDISELCCSNLPELTEMNALVKYNILQSIAEVNSKLGAQETSVHQELVSLKTDIITQFLNIFNQISFVTEQEEILDFIQDKHAELITILSHIVTAAEDVESIKDNLAAVDIKVDNIKDDINILNEKIASIISSDGDIDYVYSLQDLESDIAKLRLTLNELKENNNSKELEELINSTNGIYNLVDSLKKELPKFDVEEFKKDFEALNEDIVSISTRTNKLILASDESYKTLQENLQDFKLVINDLDERTRNFAHESGLDKIDYKLGVINSMIQSGAKTNQVFNQVFEYLAEWVDNAGAQITAISDKVETLDDIGQIKVMLEDLKAEAEDNSESTELIEALSNVFDKQAKKISSLEAKLDRVIVETTISNKNNKIDMAPIEETLNRFLVAIDDKMISQQAKINSLESKLEDVMSMINPNDTVQLTKKVGGMDRQIAKLNKSIEKIASHVVEK